MGWVCTARQGPLASSGPRRGRHSWASTRDDVIVENARISKLEYIMVCGFHQSSQLFTLHDSVFWVGVGVGGPTVATSRCSFRLCGPKAPISQAGDTPASWGNTSHPDAAQSSGARWCVSLTATLAHSCGKTDRQGCPPESSVYFRCHFLLHTMPAFALCNLLHTAVPCALSPLPG